MSQISDFVLNIRKCIMWMWNVTQKGEKSSKWVTTSVINLTNKVITKLYSHLLKKITSVIKGEITTTLFLSHPGIQWNTKLCYKGNKSTNEHLPHTCIYVFSLNIFSNHLPSLPLWFTQPNLFRFKYKTRATSILRKPKSMYV